VFVILVSSLLTQPPSSNGVVIADLVLDGATRLSRADSSNIASEVKSYRYSKDNLNEIADRVRYDLEERGFFKAIVQAPVSSIAIAGRASNAVSVSVSVEEGSQYRLRAISFSGDGNTFPMQDIVAFVCDCVGSAVESATASGKVKTKFPRAHSSSFQGMSFRGSFRLQTAISSMWTRSARAWRICVGSTSRRVS
jgi:hypothetical protein